MCVPHFPSTSLSGSWWYVRTCMLWYPYLISIRIAITAEVPGLVRPPVLWDGHKQVWSLSITNLQQEQKTSWQFQSKLVKLSSLTSLQNPFKSIFCMLLKCQTCIHWMLWYTPLWSCTDINITHFDTTLTRKSQEQQSADRIDLLYFQPARKRWVNWGRCFLVCSFFYTVLISNKVGYSVSFKTVMIHCKNALGVNVCRW